MAIVIQLVRDFAPWIYGACALIALWYLRAAFLARRDRRYAVFSLEREAALNRTYSGWTVAFVLLAILGVIYFVSTVVFDAVQPLVETDTGQTVTPQSGVQANPLATLPLPDASTLLTPTATTIPPTPRPRPTRPPEPTMPVATQAPAVQAPRCPDADSIITSPGLNARVSGMVAIGGTAANDQFQYYKLEFGAGPNPTVWSYFAGGERPVRGGHLGMLNAGALPPGTYSIRLVVVDVTGNYPPPCQTVVVVN